MVTEEPRSLVTQRRSVSPHLEAVVRRALEKLRKHLKKKKVPLFAISAATGEGLQPLLEAMWKEVAPLLPPPSEQESVRPKPSAFAPPPDHPDEGDGQ